MKSITIPTLAILACFAFGNTARAADSKLSNHDQKFIKEAATEGKEDIKLSELATQKAERADVKAFAEMMMKDHSTTNADLEKLAQSKNVDVSAVVAPKTASAFQSLEKQSGKDFDKDYLKEMEKNHKNSVSEFESAAKKAEDSDLKAFIDKTLPGLRQHLEKVKELREKK